MAWNLPKLPGYTFPDPGKSQYHVAQKLIYKNGIPIATNDTTGVGGDSMDLKGTSCLETNQESVFNPRLVYGGVSVNQYPPFKPRFALYDNMLLIFKAYIKQNDNVEYDCYQSRRNVTIIYYLEDDTLTVVEPHIMNSGLWQGKVVKKGKIMKDNKGNHWHWKDLNVGVDLNIQGIVFHTTSCDDFTKRYLKSQGIEVGKDEQESENINTEVKTEKKFTVTDSKDDSFRNLERFLKYENASLQFDAIWDDNYNVKKYKINYYLYDNTIEIKENIDINIETDTCPKLLKRTKVLKNWKKQIANSPVVAWDDDTTKEDEKYFKPEDLIVGTVINILGRNFLLYDCDEDTRAYYKEQFNITQDKRISIPDLDKRQKLRYPFPRNTCPHTEEEDSCVSFENKPSHKEVIQYNLNNNKALRYYCEMISVHPENIGRKFILLYNLSDGTIRVDELPVKNSGLIPGRFSGPYKAYIPDEKNVTYTPDMFYIGAIIKINQQKFCITGADLFVYKYMMEFPDKFPREVVQNMRDYQLRCGNIDYNEISSISNIENTRDKQEIEGCECEPQSDNEYFKTGHKNWKANQLDYPLQGMESAQALPDDYEKFLETQPMVCLTGLTSYQDDSQPKEIIQQNICNNQCQKNINIEEKLKKVTFNDTDDCF